MIETSQPLPWPGFEPGLSRPQREVLTTIRSRPFCQLMNGRLKTGTDIREIFQSLNLSIFKYLTFCMLDKIVSSRRYKFRFSKHHSVYHKNLTIWLIHLEQLIPGGLVVRIRRSHRRGRGSIPRLGRHFSHWLPLSLSLCEWGRQTSFPAKTALLGRTANSNTHIYWWNLQKWSIMLDCRYFWNRFPSVSAMMMLVYGCPVSSVGRAWDS